MLRKILVAVLLGLIPLALAACITISPMPNPTPNEDDRINTLAAQTVSALGTEIASGHDTTLVPVIWPTLTPTVTPTPTPTPTGTQAPAADCNRAAFVGDVTIPDGSTILPNSKFTKTWELKNTGSCTWNTGYAVIFGGKTAMGGPGATPLVSSGEVKPGTTVKVSINLQAPGELGDYEGYWMLRSNNNQSFGIGPNGTGAFFVKIHVAEQYSFAEQLCSAQWSSSNSNGLPCPGKDGDSAGFVLPYPNPIMEDNQQREGLGMVMMPQPAANGQIVGKFPAVVVPDHSDFRATVSCAPGDNGCYIHFKITYSVDNGPEQVLDEGNEGHEGGVTDIVKDLDMVAGKSTAFNFYVTVNGGTPDQSKGLWFDPKIIKN